MNERIKELADKCTEFLEFKTEPGHTRQQLRFDKAKFAELIVRECMKLNSKELSITAIERLLPLYQEHFGVEE